MIVNKTNLEIYRLEFLKRQIKKLEELTIRKNEIKKYVFETEIFNIYKDLERTK
jgi:hypothetical protein